MHLRLAAILFLIGIKGSLFSQSTSLTDQLNGIDQLKDDSTAFVKLQQIIRRGKLNTKDLLNVSHRLMTRAYSLQKFTTALKLGNENLIIAKQNNLDSLEATFYKLIGVTNYYMDRRRDAVPYFEKALAIAKEHGYWEFEASCNNNIGGALADVQEYDKAEPFLLDAISIMIKNGKENAPATLRSYRVLARLYSITKREEKAEPIYLKLIEKAKENKDTAFLCDNLLFYADILRSRGEFAKAVEMSGQALDFKRKKKNQHDLHTALSFHSFNLAKAGRYKEAHELAEEETYLLRTMFKKDLEKEISELEVKYKTAQLRQEKELAELKTKKQKQIYMFSIIGLLVITATSIFIWNQRKKSKHLTELAEIEKSRFKDVIEAEEKERSRIAQELHDGLGQLLSTARLNVAGLEDSVTAEDKPNVERSLKIIDDACVEVRSISHNMMPSALIRLGLIPAIREVVNNVNSAKAIKIDFTTNVDCSLGKSLDITIYRVVQEILNNMIRHAKASQIDLDIQKNGDDLKIRMQDNGVGFNTDELKESKGIGWKNIFSRVSMLNGDINLESEPQKGTLVYINLKLSRKQI